MLNTRICSVEVNLTLQFNLSSNGSRAALEVQKDAIWCSIDRVELGFLVPLRSLLPIDRIA